MICQWTFSWETLQQIVHIYTYICWTHMYPKSCNLISQQPCFLWWYEYDRGTCITAKKYGNVCSSLFITSDNSAVSSTIVWQAFVFLFLLSWNVIVIWFILVSNNTIWYDCCYFRKIDCQSTDCFHTFSLSFRSDSW